MNNERGSTERGSNERRSPITGELHVVRADEPVDSRWRRLWERVSHIYRTRVRTTTVLLVVAFVVGIVLYMFSANHYGVIPDLPEQQGQTPATRVEPAPVTPSTATTAPSTDENSATTEPSGASAPESSTTAPSTTTSTHAIFPRLPTTSRPAPSQ